MLLDRTVVDPQAPITFDEAKAAMSSGGMFADDPALRLVCNDTLRAEQHANVKAWVLGHVAASALYQSPWAARYWSGTQTERANISMYTVAKAVNSLVPQIINGLFYANPPFVFEQRPGTRADAARAVGAVIAYQLEDINFREEMRLGCINAVLYGTGIWKWGWETFTRERKVYERTQSPTTVRNPLKDKIPGAQDVHLYDDEEGIEEKVVEEYIDRPFFEHIVNLRHILVDPGLNVPNIGKGKYVVHRMYMTWDDLDKLRERPGFKIPSREKLLELFFPPREPVEAAAAEISIKNPLWDARSEPRYETTTEDPFEQPLEVLERWDDKRCIVVLQKKLVICNDENPYGMIPFLSVGWWDVPEAFYSLGLSKTIGHEQRLQQGITNLWLDNAALNLNGVYVRVKGKSIPTQSIRIEPGKIVEVDNKDDFQPLQRLPAVPEAAQHLQLSQSRAEQISGANEISTQGIAGSSGHSNIARTATGAAALGAGSAAQSQDFVEKIANQVVVPLLYAIHEMNRSLLPMSTLKYILNDELQHEFTKSQGDLLEILNARVKFSILAAAKMKARQAIAQALPILIQFLMSPETTQHLQVAGKKVEVQEILKLYFEVAQMGSEYYDIVVPMTQQDEERWKAMQPAAQMQQKMQMQSQMQQQKAAQQSDLIDQENTARAGREILRHAMEQDATTEALTGAPNPMGQG